MGTGVRSRAKGVRWRRGVVVVVAPVSSAAAVYSAHHTDLRPPEDNFVGVYKILSHRHDVYIYICTYVCTIYTKHTHTNDNPWSTRVQYNVILYTRTRDSSVLDDYSNRPCAHNVLGRAAETDRLG